MVNNPCYPSYAIRDLYMHDGFDYVILVEDNLARLLVRHCIDKEKLSRSKLINIIPVGGWRNVLNLQNELFQSSSFGVGTKIFCVLDGDIKNDAVKSEKYQGYPKLFLPVSSVEKLLRDTVILDNEDNSDKLLPLRKELKDIFFIRRSLNEILADYHQDNKKNHTHDADGKKLYRAMIEELTQLNISEETFIERLAGLIENYFSFIKFEEQLRKMLS